MIVGAVVLAGGRSRRMGTPKAQLDWHGVPLVVHVAEAVGRVVDGPVVVVAAPGQALPALPAGVRTATDSVEGRGPLQGLAAGLAAVDADAAFVCATDQPFAWRLASVLRAALTQDDDAVAFDGQPLGALYRTSLAAVAEQHLAGGDASLRGLLAAVRTRTLPPTSDDATDALRSLDTPEAYRAALRS